MEGLLNRAERGGNSELGTLVLVLQAAAGPGCRRITSASLRAPGIVSLVQHVYLCMYLCVCLCLCVSVCLFLCVGLCMCLCVWVCVTRCLCICLCLYLCIMYSWGLDPGPHPEGPVPSGSEPVAGSQPVLGAEHPPGKIHFGTSSPCSLGLKGTPSARGCPLHSCLSLWEQVGSTPASEPHPHSLLGALGGIPWFCGKVFIHKHALRSL